MAIKHNKYLEMISDRGTVTFSILAIVLAALLITQPLVVLGGVICAKEDLTRSADLVALAGATEFLVDQPNPCSVARQAAIRNNVKLLECTASDSTVVVKVQAIFNGQFKLLGIRQLTAQAKAGL